MSLPSGASPWIAFLAGSKGQNITSLSGNNCHAVHRSLSSGASVYDCSMGFYLVPYCQPSPPTRFLLITAIGICHFRSRWNGMCGRAEGQYTTNMRFNLLKFKYTDSITLEYRKLYMHLFKIRRISSFQFSKMRHCSKNPLQKSNTNKNYLNIKAQYV